MAIKIDEARKALEAYIGREAETSYFPEDIADLITDLMHLGDSMAKADPTVQDDDDLSDWDAVYATGVARANYEHEVAGDD